MVLSLRVHFAQTLSAGNVLYQKHYTCTPASAGIVHLDATAQSTECHMTQFEPIRLQNILGSCIIWFSATWSTPIWSATHLVYHSMPETPISPTLN